MHDHLSSEALLKTFSLKLEVFFKRPLARLLKSSKVLGGHTQPLQNLEGHI